MKPNRVEAIVLAVIAIALVAAIVISHQNETFFKERFVVEDGWTEWTTVFALLGGAWVMFRRGLRCSDKPVIFFRLVCFGAAFVFFFGAGEEISWGQRIFDIETPEAFEEINKQGELGFHNMVIGDFDVNKIIFSKVLGICIALYALILPLLYGRLEGFRALVDRMGIPVARPIHTVAWIVLIICTESGAVAGGKSGEMTEFGGSLLFLLIMLYPRNAAIFRRP